MNVELVGEINKHTHPPSQDQIKVAKIKASIKRRSEATHDTPQQILEAALQNISKTAAVKLLQINNLKLTIHSQRKDNGLPPTLYVEKIFLCCQKVPGNKGWRTMSDF